MSRALVLTYHSINIDGNDYCGNDHVALAEDLRILTRAGFRIVPLARIVEACMEGGEPLPDRAVALSFDDGAHFDWHDFVHPTCGFQRSFRNLILDFAATEPGRFQTELHASSFVIACPDAREELDRTCLVGRNWWTDDWWPEAVAEGLISIENHSWDHHHDTLQRYRGSEAAGNFHGIDSFDLCQTLVRQAGDYIHRRCHPHRARFFAYPYGDWSPYLAEEYLPNHGPKQGLDAAFTIEPGPVTTSSDRWKLPRYVCGLHWTSPEELEKLLRDSAG